MKLNVGRNSIIARNLNSILWSIISFFVIYAYVTFYLHVVEKYDKTTLSVWGSDYSASVADQLIFIGGLIIGIIFLIVLISNIIDFSITTHYFKKTKTNITANKILTTTYGFPFSKNNELIIVDDISELTINQYSIERLMGCGSIFIKGYSNSNYSKTDFELRIDGVDNVLEIKDSIESVFNSALAKNKNESDNVD